MLGIVIKKWGGVFVDIVVVAADVVVVFGGGGGVFIDVCPEESPKLGAGNSSD